MRNYRLCVYTLILECLVACSVAGWVYLKRKEIRRSHRWSVGRDAEGNARYGFLWHVFLPSVVVALLTGAHAYIYAAADRWPHYSVFLKARGEQLGGLGAWAFPLSVGILLGTVNVGTLRAKFDRPPTRILLTCCAGLAFGLLSITKLICP